MAALMSEASMCPAPPKNYIAALVSGRWDEEPPQGKSNNEAATVSG